jgi:hypothetical protein
LKMNCTKRVFMSLEEMILEGINLQMQHCTTVNRAPFNFYHIET